MVLSTAPNDEASTRPVERLHVLIVVPVFNDWESFVRLVGELGEVGTASDLRFTVIAVDDGSSQPPPALEHLRKGNIEQIRLVQLVRNLGHQRAIAVGMVEVYREFDQGSYAAVIVMDGDGEDPPSDVPALVHALAAAPDGVAVAARRKRRDPLLVRVGYVIYKLLYRILCNHTLDFGNYCAISPAALEQLVHTSDIWNHLAATVSKLQCKIVRVPHNRGRRYDGTSKMTIQSLVLHGMSALSAYTDVILLRLMFATLAFAAATGIIIAAILFVYFFTSWPIRGWTSVVATVLFVILIQVLAASAAASFVLLSNRNSISRIPVHELPIFIRRRRVL